MIGSSALPARVVPGVGPYPGWVEFASPSPTTVYLSGSSNPATRAAARFREDLGLLVTYRSGYGKQIRDGRYRVWAADNGIYSRHPWDEAAWWRFTAALPRTGRCLFVTAPDVLFDAAGTLRRSAAWLPRIRALGFPAALVAQDGVEDLLTEEHWAAFDALFVGGSDAWKESAAVIGLMAEARARGKWTHVGRVNTRRRLWPLAGGGADSVDGTKVAAGSDRNLPQLLGWLDELRTETFPDHQQHRFLPVLGVPRREPAAQPGAAGVSVRACHPREVLRLRRAASHVEWLLTAAAATPDPAVCDPHAVAAMRTLLTAARAALGGSVGVTTRRSGWPAGLVTGPAAGPAAPVQLSLFDPPPGPAGHPTRRVA